MYYPTKPPSGRNPMWRKDLWLHDPAPRDVTLYTVSTYNYFAFILFLLENGVDFCRYIVYNGIYQ